MDLILSIKTQINHFTEDPVLEIVTLLTKPQAQVSSLTWLQRLVILTQRMSTTALHSIPPNKTFPLCNPTDEGRAYLYINNSLITKKFHTAITRAWCTSDLRMYITHKFKWPLMTCDTLDWYSLGSTLQKSPRQLHK